MALQRHWKRYPPVHVMMAITNGLGEEVVGSTPLEDQLFGGGMQATPLSQLPPDVQKFISEHR
jgi:hypothetical protein